MRPQDSQTEVDPATFRRTLGRFSTGVTVVTTSVDGDLHGMTANAFSSVSIDPPLVLVCVDESAKMHGYIAKAGSFAITILSAGQRDLSDRFASPGRMADGDTQFADLPWSSSRVFGHPVLSEGLACLDCEVSAMHPAGDHSIVVGAVHDAQELAGAVPLAYYAGDYWRLEKG